MKVASSILAVFSILVIMIPASGLWAIEEYTLDQITIALEEVGAIGTFQTGEYIDSLEGLIPGGFTAYGDLLYSFGWGISPVPFIQTVDTVKITPSTQKVGYEDNITYSGTDHIALLENYESQASQIATKVYHYLNITSHEITELDAMLINSTSTHGNWGLHFILGTGSSAIGLDYPASLWATVKINGSFAVAVGPNLKLELLAYPESNVWLYYSDLNTSELVYTFSIEKLDLSSVLVAQPLVLTKFLLGGIVAVSSVLLVFSTDLIDIKLDRKK